MKSLLSRMIKGRATVETFSSGRYWDERYRRGGNSGPGSYGDLANFKAELLNHFVAKNSVTSIIEFGCGDGNQLAMATYPQYIGYDVSHAAVDLCRKRFREDDSKAFYLADEYDGRKADLSLSLDVIFHLTEDAVFEKYMRRLFDASNKHVIVYSSNVDNPIDSGAPHVRHRNFTKWVEEECFDEWHLVERIVNAFPYNGDYRTTSFSDFFIYARR